MKRLLNLCLTLALLSPSLVYAQTGGATQFAHGTLAQRPATCKTSRGEVYWQTDATGAGPGLDVCVSDAWLRIASDLYSQGTLASRPAAAQSNKSHFYFATDTNGGTLYFSTGSVWVKVGLGLTEAIPESQVTNLTSDLAAKATTAALTAHTSDTSNPHAVTKTQVGLGNVDNTSDANKPVSTAQQAALDAKANVSHSQAAGSVTDLGPTVAALLVQYGLVAAPVDNAAAVISNKSAQLVSASTQYFSRASNAGLQPDASFSIAVWFYSTTIVGNYEIANKGWDSGTNQWLLRQAGTTVKMFVNTSTGTYVATSAAGVTANKWHLAIGRYDAATGKVGISLDGAAFVETSGLGTPVTGSGAFTLGSREAGQGSLNGYIDSSGYWKTVALADAVALTLWNAGDGKIYSTLTAGEKTGMVSWWDFGPTAGIYKDSHGTNDLTINGSIVYGRGLASDKLVTGSISGQNYEILVPAYYDATVGAPLVLFHHGSGVTEDRIRTYANFDDIRRTLLSAGYIIASSNEHGANWGSEDALTDIVALYKRVTALYSVTRTVHLSESMGGLSGLLSIAQGRIPNVKGWAGIYPVTSLSSVYSGSFLAAINSAYLITGTAPNTYAIMTAGHDPQLMSASTFGALRFRFYASPSDVTVSKTSNSDLFDAKMDALPALESVVVVASGTHGDPSHFQASDLQSFFDRCL